MSFIFLISLILSILSLANSEYSAADYSDLGPGSDVNYQVFHDPSTQTKHRQHRNEYPRKRRQDSYGEAVGPVHTFVKTDEHAHFKWGVRHHIG